MPAFLVFLVLTGLVPVPEPYETTLGDWMRNGPEVVRRQYVYEVHFTDRRPNSEYEWGVNTDHPYPQEYYASSRHLVPPDLYFRMSGYCHEAAETSSRIGLRRFEDEGRARAALSRAAIEWAKTRKR